MAGDLRLTHAGPLGVVRAQVELPAGLSVAELVAAAGVPLADDLVVYVGDTLVPRADWPATRPPAGAAVVVCQVPQGGGDGTKVLRTVALIAVMAVAWYAGGAVAAAYSSTFAGGLAAAGVGILGSLAVNALIPPATPSVGALSQERASQAYAWSGTRNRANPFGTVPRVLGRHRLYPCYAAEPYTEVVGDDHYVHLLLDCGYGPLRLDELRLGETLASGFGDAVEVELREGWPTDPPLTLWRQTVLPEAVNVLLTAGTPLVVESDDAADELVLEFAAAGLVEFAADGRRLDRSVTLEVGYRPAGSSEQWRTDGVIGRGGVAVAQATLQSDTGPVQVWRTTQRVTSTYLSFTLPSWPAGVEQVLIRAAPTGSTPCYVGTATPGGGPVGVPAALGQTLDLHLTGQRWEQVWGAEGQEWSAWVDAADCPDPSGWSYYSEDTAGASVTLTDRRETLVRRGLRIVTGSPGRYEVRVVRLTADATAPTVRDQVSLATLQTVRYADPAAALLGRRALVALRVRATDQLQGSLDQVSVLAQALVPRWDPDTQAWTAPEPTSSPAWAYAEVLRGAATERPVPDARINGPDLAAWASECQALGLEFNGVCDWPGTVWQALGLIAAAGRAAPGQRDGLYTVVRDLAQAAPVQVFTPRNSHGFRAERVFAPPLHGLRCRFADRLQGYAADERVVYADGYHAGNATRLETLELVGVTHPDQVWVLGRYHLAVAALRPETYTWQTDFEGLVCTRGDRVALAHDVLLVGLGWGRVKSRILDTELRVTALTLDAAMPAAAGQSYALRWRRDDLTSALVPLSNPGDGEHTTLALATPSYTAPAVGDLVAYGETGAETLDVVVTRVEPGPDLTVTLTGVAAAPGVLTAHQGPIPPYQSLVTLPPALNRPAPPPPALAEVRGVLATQADGTRGAALGVTLTWTIYNRATPARWYELQYRPQGAGDWLPGVTVRARPGTVTLPGVETGVTYEVRVRAVGRYGEASAWVTGSCAVPADLTPPAAPASLTATFGATARWTWSRNTESDFSHYLLSLDGFASSWVYLAAPEGAFPAGYWPTGGAAGPAEDQRVVRYEITAPTARAYTLSIRAVDRSGNQSATVSATATLPVPAAPQIAHLGDLVDHDRVVLVVSEAQAKPPGWVGWRFQWRAAGGEWADVIPDPAPYAVWQGALAAGTEATIEWRYAAVDVVGVGEWSAATVGVVILPGLAQALADAANALAVADGKIESFWSATPPEPPLGVGDLWFDLSDGNRVRRWDGAAWLDAQDDAIGTAIGAAADAQATADGKVTTYYAATSAPPAAPALGDLWYRTDTKRVVRWDGAAWTDVASLNTGALADLDLVATAHLAGQAVSQVTYVADDGHQFSGMWDYAGAAWIGYGSFFSATITPGAGATGALLEVSATLQALTIDTLYRLRVWRCNNYDVRTWGNVALTSPGDATLTDTTKDFVALGIVPGNSKVFLASAGNLVSLGLVTAVSTTQLALAAGATYRPEAGQGYAVLRSDADTPVLMNLLTQPLTATTDLRQRTDALHASFSSGLTTRYFFAYCHEYDSPTWAARGLSTYDRRIRALLLKR